MITTWAPARMAAGITTPRILTIPLAPASTGRKVGTNYSLTLIDSQTVTTSPTNPQNPGTFQIQNLTNDPSRPYLLVVADPANVIQESNEDNNIASLLLPDIVPTALTWNTARGGIDLSYAVTGSDLPQNTTVALYWASGPAIGDIIGAPPYSASIQQAARSY